MKSILLLWSNLGFSAFRPMHVSAPFKTASALNVNELFGITVDKCSNVRFVRGFFVKMTNSSTKQNAKYWNQKIINVDLVINLVNGVVCR